MAHILIVDDSEILRQKLKADIEEQNHRVSEAGDGVEGLDFLSSHQDVDLIFCDINMPNMDGLTMCSQFTKEYPDRKIPILMLTANIDKEMKETAKSIGVRAWVTKPYKKEAVLKAIEKLTKKE